VAYLDIKNRVINTQNTGSMGVQNLSKDLESRFSNLSLKQAKLEEQLADYSKTLETATAALQVNLKKTATEVGRLTDAKPDRSELTALSSKTEASVTALQKDLAELSAAFSKFDEELVAQLMLLTESLKKDQGRLSEIEKKTLRMDTEKLSKESMDLALGLERLALQEMVKDKIREIEKKLAGLGKQMDTLNQRLDQRVNKAPPAAQAPVVIPPPPPSPTPSGSTNIMEQTIN
jgi:chromosome segregation ATPase